MFRAYIKLVLKIRISYSLIKNSNKLQISTIYIIKIKKRRVAIWRDG